MKPEEIIKKIEKELYSKDINPELVNFGIVESIGDEIVKASGLSNVGYYEEVSFEDGSFGFVLNIDKDVLFAERSLRNALNRFSTDGWSGGVPAKDDRRWREFHTTRCFYPRRNQDKHRRRLQHIRAKTYR